MTAPQAPEVSEDVVAPPPTEPGRLHRPRRAWIALAELILAGGAVWLAFYCWPRGIHTITTVLNDGTELESTRYYGNWLGAAIALGTVAGVLVLDALRQIVLAVRIRPRRRHRA